MEIREQSIWALGNIAGDSPETRNRVLANGALDRLIEELSKKLLNTNTDSLMRNMVWAVANLCRGKPSPEFHLVSPVLPLLRDIIMLEDKEMLADACWALNYLSDGSNDRIQAVLDTGCAPQLVKLMGRKF